MQSKRIIFSSLLIITFSVISGANAWFMDDKGEEFVEKYSSRAVETVASSNFEQSLEKDYEKKLEKLKKVNHKELEEKKAKSGKSLSKNSLSERFSYLFEYVTSILKSFAWI